MSSIRRTAARAAAPLSGSRRRRTAQNVRGRRFRALSCEWLEDRRLLSGEPPPDVALRTSLWNTVRDMDPLGGWRGVDVTYQVDGALPSGTPLEIAFSWASGPDPENALGDPIATRTLDPTQGTHTTNDPAFWAPPPAGTSYLLAVADPDDLIEESDETNNWAVLPIHPAAEILANAVSATRTDSYTVSAEFRPGGGLFTLSEAEVVLGVHHFNWVLQTYLPDSMEIRQLVEIGYKILEAHPFLEPAQTVSDLAGLRLFSKHAVPGSDIEPFASQEVDDDLFYWNEPDQYDGPETNLDIRNYQSGGAVFFRASPRLPNGFYGPGESSGFYLRLMGVSTTGDPVDFGGNDWLYWASDTVYEPTPGSGVSIIADDDDALPPPVSGGVTPPQPVAVIAPIARDDAATAGQQGPVTIDVLRNDRDPQGGALRVAWLGTATHGLVEIDDRGTPDDPTDDQVRYTPAPGFAGDDEFPYAVVRRNGGPGLSIARVAVHVPGPLVGLGVAGDSLSDEYAQEPYAYAQNWVEILASQGVNFGTNAAYGEPRREGFEFNWARAGATTESLLVQGQHLGVAGQAAAGQVNYAVLAIGQNDFAPGGAAYSGIYAQGIPDIGWTSTQIDALAAGIIANVRAAMETLVQSGAHVVLANIADYGVAPLTQQLYPEATRRELVTEVIAAVNAQLVGLAAQFGVPLVDLFGLTQTYFGTNTAPVASQTVGGQVFWNQAGEDVHDAFVADGVHPHTVPQAILANLVLEGLDAGYGVDVAPFWLDEAEIVGLVGLTYGGQDTLNLDYARYVVLPPANRPPVGVEDHYTTDEEVLLSVSAASGVLANDSDPDGQTLLASLVRGAGHGAVTLDPEGSFRYQPEIDFAGLDSFVYAVDDGVSAPVHVTVWISVLPVNDAPVAADDTYILDQDGALAIDVPDGLLANDYDLEGDSFVAVLDTAPQHGLLEFQADGSFRYTPDPGYFGTDHFTYRAVDADPSETAVVWLHVARALGAIDYREIDGVPVSTGPTWYRLQASHDGFLTAEASVAGNPSDAQLEWYDAGRNLLSVSSVRNGNQRLDQLASAEGVYYLRVSGIADHLDLRLVNLVRQTGGTVTVWGTLENDPFEFDAAASRVTIHGVAYDLAPSSFSTVEFDGRDGADSAVLFGTAAQESVVLSPGTATLAGEGWSATVLGTESITVDGRGGGDLAVFHASATLIDTFFAYPTHALMGAVGYVNRALGFREVTAYGTPGGRDTAQFYGSPQPDAFEAGPLAAWLTDGLSFTNRAEGFRYVRAFGDSEGFDTAVLRGTAGNESLTAQPHDVMLSGSTLLLSASGFERVTVEAGDGIDMARFFGSDGADQFEAQPGYAALQGVGFDNRASGFRYVAAYARGPGDRAQLSGSPSFDSYVATATSDTLTGPDFSIVADGFDDVTAVGMGGGDLARLCGTPGDDVFEAHPAENWVRLTGGGVSHRAQEFRYVHVDPGDGGADQALLDDSSASDTFLAYPEYAVLSSANYSYRVNGFPSVAATSTRGGADLALLYDSQDDDTYEARVAWAVLTGPGFSNRAEGFPRSVASALRGGSDQARFDYTTADDTFFGNDQTSTLLGGDYENTAMGFRDVRVQGLLGEGWDRAYLFDSPGDDLLTASGNSATLAYPDHTIELLDLSWVRATSFRGGADKRRQDAAIDFVLSTSGPWEIL